MTPEEAAEVILGGVFWCGCDDCRATGLVPAPRGEVMGFPDLAGTRKVPCVRCYGTGSVPRPPYEEACRLLGKPVPRYERPPIRDVDPKAWGKWKTVYFPRGQTGAMKTIVKDYDDER